MTTDEARTMLANVNDEIQRLRDGFAQRPKEEKQRHNALERLLPKLQRLTHPLALARITPNAEGAAPLTEEDLKLLETVPMSLREQHATCQHPACRATRRMLEAGARLVWGGGRQCELAVVAAAPTPGLLPAEVVEQRREYARHLGVDLREGTLTGDVADATTPVHVQNAVNNFVGAPRANRNAVNIGAVRFVLNGGRYEVHWPR